jgi:hypothetical protein
LSCKGQKLSHLVAFPSKAAGAGAVVETKESSLKEFEAWLGHQGMCGHGTSDLALVGHNIFALVNGPGTWGLNRQQAKVRLVEFPGRGRGLQATAPVKAGDILFALPTTALITDHDDDEESNQLMHRVSQHCVVCSSCCSFSHALG